MIKKNVFTVQGDIEQEIEKEIEGRKRETLSCKVEFLGAFFDGRRETGYLFGGPRKHCVDCGTGNLLAPLKNAEVIVHHHGF